jgi:hypothetical protein
MYANDEKAIQIPQQHYVGFTIQVDSIPLGYMTPEGKDATAKKRKQKIDIYCLNANKSSSSSLNPSANTRIIDNKPMLGFKLSKSTKKTRGWGKGEVMWRIEDPRGFELDISSRNLMQILSCCTCENGEILEKCVWGRLASENILIPVSSGVYKNARENTDRLTKRTHATSVKSGNRVMLRNGIEGIFLGKFFPLVDVRNVHQTFSISNKRLYFVAEQNNEGLTSDIHVYTSLNASEIVSHDEIVEFKALEIINHHFSVKANRKYFAYTWLVGAINTCEENTKINVELLPVTTEYLASLEGINHQVILRQNNAEHYLGYSYYWSRKASFEVSKIDIEKFLFERKIVFNEIQAKYSFPNSFRTNITKTIDLKHTADWKFFLVRYQVSNQTMQVAIDV